MKILKYKLNEYMNLKNEKMEWFTQKYSKIKL